MKDKLVQSINHSLLQSRELYYSNILDKNELLNTFKYENNKYNIQMNSYKTINNGVITEWLEGNIKSFNVYKIGIKGLG